MALLAGCSGGSDSPPAILKAGEFVPSFGTNGIATLEGGPLGNARASARFDAADANGTIRATGGALGSSVLAHLAPGGTPDAAFAGNGVHLRPADPLARLPFDNSFNGLAVLPRADGTEVHVEAVHVPCVGGLQCAITGGGYDFTTTRLFGPTGVPLPGFGTGGEGAVALAPYQALAEPAGAVLILGKAVAGPAGARRNALVRLTAQGLPDEAFDAIAAASIDCPGLEPLYSTGAAMARQADGKLLLAQSFGMGTPQGGSRTCVSRLLPDGAIDATYGTGGRFVLGPGFQSDRMSPVALFALPNGGSALFLQQRRMTDFHTNYFYMIATMTPDGALDASRLDRGINGPTDLHVARLTAVAMQGDGKYLVAGYPPLNDNMPAPPGGPVDLIDLSQPRIGRLHAAGGADLSFGTPGSGYTPLLSFGRRLGPLHVGIGPERGILVAGFAAEAGPVNENELTKFGIAKLAGDSDAAQ
jgi:hypothetical protein